MPWRIGNVPLPVPGMAVAGPTSAAHSFGTALECCINLEQSMGSVPDPRNLYGALMSLSIQGITGAKGSRETLALFLGRSARRRAGKIAVLPALARGQGMLSASDRGVPMGERPSEASA